MPMKSRADKRCEKNLTHMLHINEMQLPTRNESRERLLKAELGKGGFAGQERFFTTNEEHAGPCQLLLAHRRRAQAFYRL